MKIVFIAPHLSTGGMPQYLVKQIESIKDDVEVYCIEWENVTGGVLVVQRNKVVNLLGDRLITLRQDKHELLTILERLQPDVVHLQEIPELFMSSDVAHKLYDPNRPYVIIETSHDSGYDVNNKSHFPDKFLMVSKYQIRQYESLGIPIDLVEYPIEYKTRTKTREQALRDLGLDPNLKHVINVGLFTPRKNQAEIVEYARLLQNYPIQFHFIGNQAENFQYYWEPLMKNFPPNCKWWNERTDVDTFYEAADLFLFTSRGNATDHETMPLVIREALGWKIPSLIYNLPVYMGYFDKYDTIEYLTDNLQKNAYTIAEKFFAPTTERIVTSNKKECIIISAYPTTESATEITKESIVQAKKFNIPIILTSHCPIPKELQELVDYCVVDTNNILTYHTHYNRAWFTLPGQKLFVQVNLLGENNNIYHGPAAYTNYYNGLSFARNMGFTQAYCWNYDIYLRNDTTIKVMDSALSSYKMVIGHNNPEEGDALQTELFGVDIDFFLSKFPRIKTEKEYTEWMHRVGSESNGLENMWYHTVKHDLNHIKLWSMVEYMAMMESSERDICSQVEYYTVLPLESDPTKIVMWASSSNKKDSRVKKFYVNDELIDTIYVTSARKDYKILDISQTHKIRFEVLDIKSNMILMDKTIILDEEYIKNKLKNNGIFRYENS